MTGDVRIQNLNIGNVFVMPDAVPGAMPDSLIEFLKDQIRAGADPAIMGEDGYPTVSEDVAQADDPPTPEEQDELDRNRAERYIMEQAEVDVVARANHLRNVVHHVTPARKLEGFQTNHERSPRKRSTVDKKQAEELKLAEISLKRACARCVFQNDCRLVNDIGVWVDVHPYQDDRTGKRRPGSSEVREVESRKDFLKSLAVGVAKKRQAHCDPAKRR
jgi:hypothetical protein